jgi:hypothetical protein
MRSSKQFAPSAGLSHPDWSAGISQSLVVAGPLELGEGWAAAAIRALVCEGTKDASCRCRACQIGWDRHPDVHRLRPEPKTIRREAVTAAVSHLWMRPLWGQAVVVAILEADRMTPEAQNHLLKVLEEPPPYAHLLLVTARPDQLLATVLSRCQLVRVRGGEEPSAGGDPGEANWLEEADWPSALVRAAWAIRTRYLDTGRAELLELWDLMWRLYRDAEQNGNEEIARALAREAWRRVRP